MASTTSTTGSDRLDTESRRGHVADLVAVTIGIALVVAAALVGWRLRERGVDIFLGFPPLLAGWSPHVGPGTPAAVITAALVVVHGPRLAERMSWRPLLWASYGAALAWTASLALVDGWQSGVAGRLATDQEYLHDVGKVTDIAEMLRTFSDHIRTNQDVFWTTHVGAHPPGAFLPFVWLDRLGLGGGGWAAVFVMLVGASAAVAVAVALRALGTEETARRFLPFGVLFPGAVWVGVSADGMFAGVLAWGVALFAVGAAGTGRRADLAALAGGVVLGYTLYLSYGLVLGGLLPLAVIAVTRNWRALGIGVAGVAAVAAVFTAAGFWWFTGFEYLRLIYAGSAAADRPYEYFVWANLAAVSIAIGPAVYAGLRRMVAVSSISGTHSGATPRALPVAATLLASAGLLAIAVADVSGLSKAEVERIWLPFAIWLLVSCALLPRGSVRAWLAAQAGLALAVNHLLFTVW